MVIGQRTSGPAARPESTPQSRLLRGYLHKTSNSLCGIKGYASLIAEDDILDNPAVKWARKIIQEVEKMETIFRSVGDMTGLATDLTPGATLPEVLDRALASALDQYPHLDIRCGVVPEGQLLLPAADLALALKEILRNAAESAGKEQSNVSVQLDCIASCEGRLSVRLQDNGSGIAPDLAAQVTDPFLTTKDGHLGVGLTRVDTLMDMHGLAWTITSSETQGTAVTLEAAAALNVVV